MRQFLEDYKMILIVGVAVLLGFALVFGVVRSMNKAEKIDTGIPDESAKVEDSTDAGDKGADPDIDEMGEYEDDVDVTFAGENDDFEEVTKPEGEEVTEVERDLIETYWEEISNASTILEKTNAHDAFLKVLVTEMDKGEIPDVVNDNPLDYSGKNSKGIGIFEETVGGMKASVINVVVPSDASTPNNNSSVYLYTKDLEKKTFSVFKKKNALVETVSSYGNFIVMSGRYLRPDMNNSKAQYWVKAMRIDPEGYSVVEPSPDNQSGMSIAVGNKGEVVNINASDNASYLKPEPTKGGLKFISSNGKETAFVDVSKGSIEVKMLRVGDEPTLSNPSGGESEADDVVIPKV